MVFSLFRIECKIGTGVINRKPAEFDIDLDDRADQPATKLTKHGHRKSQPFRQPEISRPDLVTRPSYDLIKE